MSVSSLLKKDVSDFKPQFMKVVNFIYPKLPVFAVSIFLFSPLFMHIVLAVHHIKHDVQYKYDHYLYVCTVRFLINWVVAISGIYYINYFVHFIKNKKETLAELKSRFRQFLPFFLFLLFSLAIVADTLIRGATVPDLYGNEYIRESIFSYIIYALGYFFCGALIWKPETKRRLLYVFLLTAAIVNILTLVNVWFFPIHITESNGTSSVFHHYNHFGYYLVIVIVCSLIMFVYEKKPVLKTLSALSGAVGTIVLIINDTFGAFLAVSAVLIAFTVYCFLCDKPNLKWALLALGEFLLITVIMSFFYHTVFSSFITLHDDIEAIAANPMDSDEAGTGRWWLWVSTVKYIKEKPLLGFGVEGLLLEHAVGTPHNELMQYAAYFGIPVMLIYLSAVVTIFVRVLRQNKTLDKMTLVCFCVSVGYFVSSMFGVAIFYTTPFFFIFLGLTYSEMMHKQSVPAVETQPETNAQPET